MSEKLVAAMTRDEARRLLEPYVFFVGIPFRAVTHEAVRLLLGFAINRLLRDPIRRWGPVAGTIYPWNVEDYLIFPDLRKDIEEQRLKATRA